MKSNQQSADAKAAGAHVPEHTSHAMTAVVVCNTMTAGAPLPMLLIAPTDLSQMLSSQRCAQ
jgi:hypothetical protein